jgi:hypothetical protein
VTTLWRLPDVVTDGIKLIDCVSITTAVTAAIEKLPQIQIFVDWKLNKRV